MSMAHLLLNGWTKTACGRSIARYDLDTTDKQKHVTCGVCELAIAKATVGKKYAGEFIPDVQQEVWTDLKQTHKKAFCRQSLVTDGCHGEPWYAMSKEQRDMLLALITQNPTHAHRLMMPATGTMPIDISNVTTALAKIAKALPSAKDELTRKRMQNKMFDLLERLARYDAEILEREIKQG